MTRTSLERITNSLETRSESRTHIKPAFGLNYLFKQREDLNIKLFTHGLNV